MRLEVTVGRLRQQYDEMSREKTKISSELIESEEEKMKVIDATEYGIGLCHFICA